MTSNIVVMIAVTVMQGDKDDLGTGDGDGAMLTTIVVAMVIVIMAVIVLTAMDILMTVAVVETTWRQNRQG